MPVTSYIIVYNHQNNPVRFTNAENKIQKKQLAEFTDKANSGTEFCTKSVSPAHALFMSSEFFKLRITNSI